MNFISTFLDFFLPRVCSSCGIKLTSDENFVCNQCFSSIKRTSEEILKYEFSRKFEQEEIIREYLSLFVFEKDMGLQNIIHELKYNGMFRLGKFLGKLVAESFHNQIINWSIDFIVPVPLHHLKRAERGYNQSDFIAKGISSVLSIPVKCRIIKRTRFTDTQTELNLIQRKENVHDAFAIIGNQKLDGKNILLIDDVITTGATISECGRIIMKAGAAHIYAASVAIAG